MTRREIRNNPRRKGRAGDLVRICEDHDGTRPSYGAESVTEKAGEEEKAVNEGPHVSVTQRKRKGKMEWAALRSFGPRRG
jgi:hypothetical protein